MLLTRSSTRVTKFLPHSFLAKYIITFLVLRIFYSNRRTFFIGGNRSQRSNFLQRFKLFIYLYRATTPRHYNNKKYKIAKVSYGQ